MRYLLIPSCEVAKLNSLEGTITEKRLERGLRIWEQGDFDAIVVSGGVYLPPDIQTTSSAKLMKEWLVDRGVPAVSIISESDSRDTYENLGNTFVLLAMAFQNSRPDMTVVTHWQHGLRFYAAAYLGHGKKLHLIPMWYSIGIKGFLMEWIFLLVHLIDWRGTGWIAKHNRASRTF